MAPQPQQRADAIAALQAQRSVLGDAVVDALLSATRASLAAPAAASPVAPAPPVAPVLPAPDATPLLKQVSILFLDIVGSTTPSERLDPEAISEVMGGALARVTAIVAAQHGRVLQYAGDNILAAFGADEALEDDAERAVRCGLALLELARVLAAEVLAAHGHLAQRQGAAITVVALELTCLQLPVEVGRQPRPQPAGCRVDVDAVPRQHVDQRGLHSAASIHQARQPSMAMTFSRRRRMPRNQRSWSVTLRCR